MQSPKHIKVSVQVFLAPHSLLAVVVCFVSLLFCLFVLPQAPRFSFKNPLLVCRVAAKPPWQGWTRSESDRPGLISSSPLDITNEDYDRFLCPGHVRRAGRLDLPCLGQDFLGLQDSLDFLGWNRAGKWHYTMPHKAQPGGTAERIQVFSSITDRAESAWEVGLSIHSLGELGGLLFP